LALDSEDFRVLQGIAEETARQNNERGRDKRDAKVDRRVGDTLRQLEQEEELLRRVGGERELYRLQIESENQARQAGLVAGTAEFDSYVKRRRAVQELAAAQERLADIGAQAGNALGSALEKFIIDGAKARDVARALLEDLARIAFRQTVTNQLAGLLSQAGTALAGAFGGAAAATPATPRLAGGFIPAQTGQLIDEAGFLDRGGQRFSVAEGGATTPEAIFPLERDNQGRLGIVAAGGGGGGNITMVFPAVRNAQDARAARATLGQRTRQLLDNDKRGRRGLRPRGE
jgi:hypothetical protein